MGVGVDGEFDAHLFAELDGGVVQIEAVWVMRIDLKVTEFPDSEGST